MNKLIAEKAIRIAQLGQSGKLIIQRAGIQGASGRPPVKGPLTSSKGLSPFPEILIKSCMLSGFQVSLVLFKELLQLST